MAKVPERLRVPFKAQLDKIMYAPNEDAARQEFVTLKAIMAKDASRAVSCIGKDLESLLSYYKFDHRCCVTAQLK